MSLTKKIFESLELADLLLNIWWYADNLNFPILNQYAQWNIEIAKELWKPEYQNFNEIIKNVLSKDKSLNLGEISSAEKKLVYYLIYKHN